MKNVTKTIYNIYEKVEEEGIVLYCVKGVVIAALCTATFSNLLCPPEFKYY